MSDSVETFQLSTEAAETYESKFVPALFGEWAEHVVDAAGITPGQAVIDVACGTGVVARAAAGRLQGSGRVVGVDVNEGMLAVARRIRPEIEWHHGDVADLPFADVSFDAALCQAALMYFPDQGAALGEMARVVKPGGTVTVQVWGSFESQEGYRPFAEIAARHGGSEAIELIGSYFSLGDVAHLSALFDQAGLKVVDTRTRTGAVRFSSIDEFVRAEIESTPLIDRIGDDAYNRILEESREALQPFAGGGAGTEIPLEGHVVVATRP